MNAKWWNSCSNHPAVVTETRELAQLAIRGEPMRAFGRLGNSHLHSRLLWVSVMVRLLVIKSMIVLPIPSWSSLIILFGIACLENKYLCEGSMDGVPLKWWTVDGWGVPTWTHRFWNYSQYQPLYTQEIIMNKYLVVSWSFHWYNHCNTLPHHEQPPASFDQFLEMRCWKSQPTVQLHWCQAWIIKCYYVHPPSAMISHQVAWSTIIHHHQSLWITIKNH